MYEHNINRINQKKPYINGKPNFNQENHQIKKAPIKRLLEQNTTVETGQNYLTYPNVYPDSVELVQKHLETTITQIAKLATHHALNKSHRATVMPEDITYALKKITGNPIK